MLLSRFLLIISGILGLSYAYAHAFLVLGKLESSPAIIAEDSPFLLRIRLSDQTGTAVEDAIVFTEFFLPANGSKEDQLILSSQRLTEVAEGIYQTEFAGLKAATYSLRIRDQTFAQEEARAEIPFEIGKANKDLAFWLPPTQTQVSSLKTWLLWLIFMPLAAGAVVSFLVLKNPAIADSNTAANPKKGG